LRLPATWGRDRFEDHMLTALTLPALAILVTLPGLSGFPGLSHLGLHRGHKATATDSLPPAWKTASRLALENQFVMNGLPPLRGPGYRPALELRPDPRTLHASLDPDSGRVSVTPQLGEFTVGPGSSRSLGEFSHEMTQTTFRRLWYDRTRQSINTRTQTGATSSSSRTGITFELPGVLPKRVQSLLGPGGPALNVSGSENIKLSGQSDWSNQTGALGTQRSLFPTLNMQQDLDIRLEGQLSDRIRVNLLQNSANQIPLANRIAINYRGDEDDLVQALDLGNTSLTLPGTQYVSYSGKNEGLFGVKASSRYGPLDFTVLASKQEGKSERATYAGGSSKQQQTLRDGDYQRGSYFFLYDPNGPTLDIDDATIRIYRDNATSQVEVNTIRARAYVDPLRRSGTAINDTASVHGTFKLQTPGAESQYEILNDVYNRNFKVIRMKQPLSGNQRLAASYHARVVATGEAIDVGSVDGSLVDDPLFVNDTLTKALVLKLIRPPASELKADSAQAFVDVNRANFDTVATRSPYNVVRDLELRNFYQLAGQRIDPTSLRIQIRQGTADPPVTSITGSAIAIPYIEAAGLDNFDEASGTLARGHDGKLDGTLLTSNSRPFVDYQNGILFFYDLRPFAPRIGPGGHPFEQALSNNLTRRDSLTGPADTHSTDPPGPRAANPAIYDAFTQTLDKTTYYIDVEFTAAQAAGEITLGRGNILESSEVVTVNGQAWVRDRDYTIDYDLGRVVLKRQLGAGDNLNVDYSYAPLFQQAGRTLVGSAFRMEGRKKSLGGAFLYESKGAQDLRPRIGEEPSRSLIGDLNTEWTFTPDWMTRMVDHLPGVRTTTPSEIHFQAEVGASFPNPNTKNEVYIDDMEGVRDAVSLSMGAERWRPAGLPLLKAGAGVEVAASDSLVNAELHWYTPPSAVEERDLKPTLEDAAGAKNTRQVLALSVPRRPHTAPTETTPLWAGLTYPLDPVGLDLSRSQFIEIWVNDFNDQHAPGDGIGRVRGRNVKLHVDLGAVSEDQQRSPDVPPNGILDSEDQLPHDNSLVVSDDSKLDEDTGYDGIHTTSNNIEAKFESPDSVRDLITASGSDPEGDDFVTPAEDVARNRDKSLDPRSWLRPGVGSTNGSEGNKNLNPTPDTEDMNLNGILDTDRDYLEYTINMGDTASRYLVTDVRREFGSSSTPTVAALANESNGWRRYRIPINDSLAVRFGAPNLTLARHVRVWLDGIVESDSSGAVNRRPLLVLGSLDIVGSRWRAADLTPAQRDSGTSRTLNSVNSIDNADIYVAPFDPGETRNGSQGLTRREQSLALEFSQFLPGDTIEAFKTFSLDENYSRYGKLDWFATGFDVSNYVASTDTLEYFLRFSSDEFNQNYYEYRAPLPNSARGAIDWREVKLPITNLSNLKLNADFPRTDPILYDVAGAAPGERYVVRGRPSFTRLRRISFGLINKTGKILPSGQLWFDELRAIDVAKDVDHAQRINVNGRLANLLSYNFGWNGRGADFLSVGESRGAGSSTDQISFGSTFDIHRFFAGTGIVTPLTVGYGRSTSKPRFTAGDDVVRVGALADASESRSESRSFSTSYSRAWGERSNPFLRYTIGGVTASYSWSKTTNISPNSKDSTVSSGAAVNYRIAPRRMLTFGLPLTKARFYPLPDAFYWNYALGRSNGQGYDRIGALRDSLLPRSAVAGRTASIDFGADSHPIDLLHHHFDAHRNLTLPPGDVKSEEVAGFINLGRVTTWRQALDSRYGLNLGTWLKPTLSWSSQYNQNNGPELSPDLSVRAVNNGQAVGFNWDLPFDRLSTPIRPAPRAAGDSTQTRRRQPGLGWRALVARLGPVSTDLSFNQSSSYSRLTGTPEPLYLLGLSQRSGLDDPTSGVKASFGNDVNRSLDWRSGARSRLQLGFGASVNTRFEMTGRKNELNGLTNRSRSMRFPSLELEYGHLSRVIGLDQLMPNVQLRTAYNRSLLEEQQNNSKTPTGRSSSSEWAPLLGVAGTLRNGTRTEMRLERRVTKREDLAIGHSTTTDRNTTLNVSLNRSYSQGQKVKMLGKTSTVNSSISVGVTGVYERHSGETVQQGFERAQLVTKDNRLSLNGTGSYGFSTNVTGNLLLGYGQSSNQQGTVRRNVRVELRAQFTF
jgi:Motility related/secretion protein